MITRKSFQFRLRPTKKQAKMLEAMLEECRWLYNEMLYQRKILYEELDISLSKYQQSMLIPLMKQERSTLDSVHSQVLQNVVDRLDKSFQAFFRRCKAGEKPGFPRFQGMHRYNSFCFPQTGFSLNGNILKLSKIGHIRIKMHRPIGGDVKTCTLKRNPSGDFDVSFSCAVKIEPKPPREEAVGIDVGLENFATFSDGHVVANPRFLKHGERSLAKVQKKLAKYNKGTKERRKQGKVVAKVHEKIANQRKDFCHKESKKIIDQYQFICVEDLNIKKMIENSYNAKSIADASWNQFLQFLTYKAVDAGRIVKLVNPAYTSQDCYKCHYRKKKELSERMHCCSHCGYTVSRDFNSSQIILALGLDGLGAVPRSLRL